MKKILKYICATIFMFVSVISLTACTDKEGKIPIGLSVECVNTQLKMVNNTITVQYDSDVSEPVKDTDFNVYVIRKNGSKVVVRENSEDHKGYTYTNTFTEKPATVGEYTLTFGYDGLDSVDVKVVVEKGYYDVSNIQWDYTIPYTYDGGEKIITLLNLPTGITAEYSNNKFTNAGKYVATAKLTHIDTENYYDLPTISITWYINKYKIDCSAIVWDYAQPFGYDGNIKEVKLINVPNNVTVTYTNNSATDVGDYVAQANLVYDNNNYEIYNFNCPQLNWTIQ